MPLLIYFHILYATQQYQSQWNKRGELQCLTYLRNLFGGDCEYAVSHDGRSRNSKISFNQDSTFKNKNSTLAYL